MIISAIATMVVTDISAMETPEQGIRAINALASAYIERGEKDTRPMKSLISYWHEQVADYSETEETLLPISELIGTFGDTEEEVRTYFKDLKGAKFAEGEDAESKKAELDEYKREGEAIKARWAEEGNNSGEKLNWMEYVRAKYGKFAHSSAKLETMRKEAEERKQEVERRRQEARKKLDAILKADTAKSESEDESRSEDAADDDD